ncbi:TonB family protein [Salinimicrobium sp. HB62]|uniref:TonB family protein n=1 Tax=Salinimicrobium sp. HB62 TaxID=3077781 RepID=UPI002D78B974|nr:TonB family protein [Salinimicrobium sp. HB62]
MARFLPPFVLLLFSLSSISQTRTYTDKNYHETINLLEAVYYVERETEAANPDAGYERFYYLSGEKRLEQYYSSFEERTLEGTKKVWRQDGSLIRESNYLKGKLHGPWISYWEDGKMKRKEVYKKGKLKEKNLWDMNSNPVEWYPRMQRPQFPGGEKARIKYIVANTTKPEGVAGGRVVVGFVIETDGSVTDVEIEESTSPALNLAAYNTVKNMPSWQPGKIDGDPVRVKLSIPLVFRD